MRHHKKGRIFGREKGQRTALIRSLACSLILRGKMKTTEAKAKEVRPFIEKLITRGKNDTLGNRRLIAARLASVPMAKKLVESVSPRYKDRNGGYTRITKLPRRMSDGAAIAHIEFI